MTDAPKITRPTYIDALPPAEAVPALRDAAGQAIDLCRRVPGSSLIGATLLGATAAYFIPKIFDFAFDALASRRLVEDLDDEDDE